ncbi:MAG: type II toxin-antitoxin system VapC family toxin, partial [Pseudomonadota bacterium]|nr:type II toxin-antitoxin system VapC family toxin [Pseudomonadota bacterium]
DTHLLLWAAAEPKKLPAAARRMIESPRNQPLFSAASLWEIAIKNQLGRKDLRVEPRTLRRGLLDNGYAELPVTGEHAVVTDTLPPLHKDPFDRLLVAQAIAAPARLYTSDRKLAPYSELVVVVALSHPLIFARVFRATKESQSVL